MSMGNLIETVLEKSGMGLGMNHVDVSNRTHAGRCLECTVSHSPELNLHMDYSRIQRFGGETISKPYTTSLGSR